ncbi:MAG: histidine kinase [Sphingomonas sp.]|nr:histidine kinase [Sphingomonas sp.]
MLRFLCGASAALLLVLAGFFAWKGMARREVSPLPPPPAAVETPGDETAPPPPPAADARTKEQRRFDRADRDKDGRITLNELYEPRRKAFARLDTNGDGRLSFEEWAVRTREKFQGADANRDGALNRTEYATTAPRARPPARQKGCAC